jgi:hypothetical protein
MCVLCVFIHAIEGHHPLVEDTYIPEQDKRWVVVAPPGASESHLLLARAIGEEQASRIGNQTGGRVFLFLYTDDCGGELASGSRQSSTPSTAAVLPKRFCSNTPLSTSRTFTLLSRTTCGLAKKSSLSQGASQSRGGSASGEGSTVSPGGSA